MFKKPLLLLGIYFFKKCSRTVILYIKGYLSKSVYIICFVLSNVLCVLHVSQTQRILVAISDQFGNCIVKYTRIDEALTYSCRRYSKQRGCTSSSRYVSVNSEHCIHILPSFCAVVVCLYFALTILDLRPLVSVIVYSLRNKLQTPSTRIQRL